MTEANKAQQQKQQLRGLSNTSSGQSGGTFRRTNGRTVQKTSIYHHIPEMDINPTAENTSERFPYTHPPRSVFHSELIP